jgi:hypothetical protein
MTLPRRFLLASALLLAACGGGDDDDDCSDALCVGDDGTPDASHPRWLVDGWYHDDGRENYADYADYYINLGEDGQGEYYDDHGIFAFAGEWTLEGKTLTVGGYALQIDWTDNCAVLSAEGKTFIGTIEADRPDCPTMTPPLTDLEACLVGDWSSSSNDGVISNSSWLTLGADRSYLETWDFSGYTSGGSAGAVEGRWQLLDSGDIEVTYPGGSSEVRSSIAGVTGMSRDSDVAAGCDEDAFDQEIAGGCSQGDPYECNGDQLIDCATGNQYACADICVQNGYSGVADPPCGPGDEGSPVCFCW